MFIRSGSTYFQNALAQYKSISDDRARSWITLGAYECEKEGCEKDPKNSDRKPKIKYQRSVVLAVVAWPYIEIRRSKLDKRNRKDNGFEYHRYFNHRKQWKKAV